MELTLSRCIVHSWWIRSLTSKSVRSANDDFVASFSTWQGRYWASPAIWDAVRQADISQVMPVAVHSHNDYLRRIPLWEALGSGCISVEAATKLMCILSSPTYLLVTRAYLWSERTPLAPCISNHFDVSSTYAMCTTRAYLYKQSLVLLIDLKDRSQKTLEELSKQLEALRFLAYLTYWNGTSRVMRTLTIVASGKVKFDDILALDPGHRDIFFDARLRPSTISLRTIGL
ncbi:hypothetical protein E4T44_00515 [Aureobasidium sp. EXF-8845]|nr:hypothetical protein E4T44_00515 [Aureobasidium sp. EXF-8845]